MATASTPPRPRRRKSQFLHTYSKWDGTQAGFATTPEDILDSISDDLMVSNDLDRIFRRLLQRGFESRSGEWVKGLREMREKLKQRRQEILDSHDLGGIYDEISKELDEIVNMEKETLEGMKNAETGDMEELNRNSQKMEELPQDLLPKIQELSDYEFTSEQASAHFQELMEKLQSQLVESYMNRMNQSFQDMDMDRLKGMLDSLNQMLEAREAGEEPDFEDFMDEYGDMFGDDPPKSLDELLEAMARSMAAMNAMWNSMSPDQRKQLQNLAEQLLEDLDLDWQFSRLSSNLKNMFQNMNWDAGYDFQGEQPMDIPAGNDIFSQLGDLDAIEEQLASASTPADLDEIDPEKARELLGDEDAQNLEQLKEIAKQLEEAGFVTAKGDGMALSPKAINHIGKKALGDIMQRLSMNRIGQHDMTQVGMGHEREFETKPYEWGDTFNLNIERTIRNAISRKGLDEKGSGVPVQIQPEDFEVDRTQQKVEGATVLMLDLSLSMEMRNNFVSAKKVAIALHSLISSKYPRDYLGVVGFSWAAKEIEPRDLMEVGVNWLDHGTNMEHGFRMARSMLSKSRGTRQIVMITDGEPTAHLNSKGIPEFYYPPVPETINKTLAEVLRVTKDQIIINIFMLDQYPALMRFVEHITKLNGGRAFYTTPDTLGEYVISDFVGKRPS